MAYENFQTIPYDETDEGSNVTLVGTKVSWVNLDRDETSHVSDSKGVNHFSGDFEHLFEIQYDKKSGVPCANWWAVANAQADIKTLVDASADAAYLQLWDTDIEMLLLENGIEFGSGSYAAAEQTTFFITLERVDDGGANNTGQYTVEIRTGSHAGPLQDTLTVDCDEGEQNDFEFIYAVQSYDDAENNNRVDGFTENLDLQEAVGEDFFRTIDDDMGVTDAMGRTQVQLRTITDGIGTIDDMGRTQVQIRTLAEALGITDALWKAETRIFADAVGITDVITKSQGYARTIADDIGIVDSESKLITYVRTLAESLGITDAMSRTVHFPRTVSDGVGITDSIVRTVTFARIVAEAMGIADVVTRTQVQLRTIADAMGLTDVMSPGQVIIFAEAMGMTDAMAHTKTQIRTITDAMGITDDLTRIATYVFTQTDDVGIGDAMIRVAIALRTVSDDIGMTDEMSGQIGELVKAAWAFMIIRQTHN